MKTVLASALILLSGAAHANCTFNYTDQPDQAWQRMMRDSCLESRGQLSRSIEREQFLQRQFELDSSRVQQWRAPQWQAPKPSDYGLD